MLLESIRSPADVRALPDGQLPQLCQELREFLLKSVSQTGGHLAILLAIGRLLAVRRLLTGGRLLAVTVGLLLAGGRLLAIAVGLLLLRGKAGAAARAECLRVVASRAAVRANF